MKKINAIGIFRWCGFAILALVSLFFIYNLSISLAVETIEKAVIVAGAIGLEFFKLFSIISATTYAFVGKQLGIKVKKRAWLYFTYIWVSIYSIGASFGYSITAIDRMQTTVTILNHDASIALEQENISNYDSNIKEYKNTKIGYENSKVASINQLSNKDLTTDERKVINKDIAGFQANLDAYQKKIDEQLVKKTVAQGKIEEYKKEDLTSVKTTNRTMFDVIHDTIKIPAKTIAFIILLVFSSSVELGIFTMAPHANKIDNMVVGEESIISTKKRRLLKKGDKNVSTSSETIENTTISSEAEPPEEEAAVIEDEIQDTAMDTTNAIPSTEGNKDDDRKPVKMESRAEEILQTLDEDKPPVSTKVRKMLIQL